MRVIRSLAKTILRQGQTRFEIDTGWNTVYLDFLCGHTNEDTIFFTRSSKHNYKRRIDGAELDEVRFLNICCQLYSRDYLRHKDNMRFETTLITRRECLMLRTYGLEVVIHVLDDDSACEYNRKLETGKVLYIAKKKISFHYLFTQINLVISKDVFLTNQITAQLEFTSITLCPRF